MHLDTAAGCVSVYRRIRFGVNHKAGVLGMLNGPSYAWEYEDEVRSVS